MDTVGFVWACWELYADFEYVLEWCGQLEVNRELELVSPSLTLPQSFFQCQIHRGYLKSLNAAGKEMFFLLRTTPVAIVDTIYILFLSHSIGAS